MIKGISSKEEMHVAINIANDNEKAFPPHLLLNDSTPTTLLTHPSPVVK